MPVQAVTTELAGACSVCGVDLHGAVTRLRAGDLVTNGLCAACSSSGHPFVFPSIRTPVTRHNRQQKRASIRQEDRIAHDIKGRRQKASGSMPHAKGDVRKRGSMRVEAKYTTGRSFTIKYDELVKIRSECTGDETPAFQFTFMDRDRKPIDEWVAVPYSVWRRLHAAAENR
jgi:hypothetical protein